MIIPTTWARDGERQGGKEWREEKTPVITEVSESLR